MCSKLNYTFIVLIATIIVTLVQIALLFILPFVCMYEIIRFLTQLLHKMHKNHKKAKKSLT